MQLYTKITVAAAMFLTSWGITSAQNYKLPETHTAQHRDLIAGQINIGKQIKVEDT